MSAIPRETRPLPCKIPLGTQYRPARHEVRTPTRYEALMPRHDRDAARLQRALLSADAKAYLSDGAWLVAGVLMLGAPVVVAWVVHLWT